jgi:hypothetical protein
MQEFQDLLVEFAVNSTVTTSRDPIEVYREWQLNPDHMPEGVVHRPIYDFRPGIILLIIDEKLRQTQDLLGKVIKQDQLAKIN